MTQQGIEPTISCMAGLRSIQSDTDPKMIYFGTMYSALKQARKNMSDVISSHGASMEALEPREVYPQLNIARHPDMT